MCLYARQSSKTASTFPMPTRLSCATPTGWDLSQLYQLRGRVGRSNRLAYAYFMYRQDKILNDDAYKRLSSITEYSELGSGFKIAMKDLEIRGAGNILGREQHGHMMKVGYEMYARLLKEAVAELRGEKQERTFTTDLEIDIEGLRPRRLHKRSVGKDGFLPATCLLQSGGRRGKNTLAVAGNLRCHSTPGGQPSENCQTQIACTQRQGVQSFGKTGTWRNNLCGKRCHVQQKGV